MTASPHEVPLDSVETPFGPPARQTSA